MTIKEIQLLLKFNNIKHITITAAPMATGKWNVLFENKNGEVVPLTARRKNIRNFSNVESVLNVLRTVGVKDASIDWSGQQ